MTNKTEQPPASEFTKDLRDEVETLQLYAAADDTRGAFKFADIYKACDRLDASEASRKELLEALEHIRIIPRNFKSGMTYEKRMVRMIKIAEAAIKKAEK